MVCEPYLDPASTDACPIFLEGCVMKTPDDCILTTGYQDPCIRFVCHDDVDVQQKVQKNISVVIAEGAEVKISLPEYNSTLSFQTGPITMDLSQAEIGLIAVVILLALVIITIAVLAFYGCYRVGPFQFYIRLKGLIFGNAAFPIEYNLEYGQFNHALDEAIANNSSSTSSTSFSQDDQAQGFNFDDGDARINVNVTDLTKEEPRVNLLDLNGQETQENVSVTD